MSRAACRTFRRYGTTREDREGGKDPKRKREKERETGKGRGGKKVGCEGLGEGGDEKAARERIERQRGKMIDRRKKKRERVQDTKNHFGTRAHLRPDPFIGTAVPTAAKVCENGDSAFRSDLTPRHVDRRSVRAAFRV